MCRSQMSFNLRTTDGAGSSAVWLVEMYILHFALILFGCFLSKPHFLQWQLLMSPRQHHQNQVQLSALAGIICFIAPGKDFPPCHFFHPTDIKPCKCPFVLTLLQLDHNKTSSALVADLAAAHRARAQAERQLVAAQTALLKHQQQYNHDVSLQNSP